MIQLIITKRCNLFCGHCMWSCNSKGQHMSPEIFEKSLTYVEMAGSVNVLGGEPTLHPLFHSFMSSIALVAKEIRVVTNGTWINNNKESIAGTLMLVAQSVGRENLFVRITNDPFHRTQFSEDNMMKAERYLHELGVNTSSQRMDNATIYPIGRARKLTLSYVDKNYDLADCVKHIPYDPWDNLSINIDGKISVCSLHQFTPASIFDGTPLYVSKRLTKLAEAIAAKTPSNSDCHRCRFLLSQ